MPDLIVSHLSRRRVARSRAALIVAAVLTGPAITAALAASPTPPAYRLARTITLPGTAAQGWDYLACDPEANRVYVAHGPEVDVIDTASGQVAGTIGGLSRSHGIALDARDGRGFISNGGDANTVAVFDLATLKTLQTIPVADGPDAIVYESHSQRVAVFSGEARAMTSLDAKTGKIFFVLPLPGRPEFAVADFRNGLLYNNYVDRSAVAELDARVHATGDVYPVAPGEHPTGLAVDNKNGRVFSGCSNKTLIVMNIETGAILSSLPIGAGVDACAFDPGLNRAYASSGGSGTVAVITRQPGTDDQYAVAATIPTLPGARTMTVDTKTHHLFVAAPFNGKLVVQEYAPVDR